MLTFFVVHFFAFFESLEMLLDVLENLILQPDNSDDKKKEKQRLLEKLVDGHSMGILGATNTLKI